MNFFYDLNKKLNSIGAAPESTQLNEGDLGKQLNEISDELVLKSRNIARDHQYGAEANSERRAQQIYRKQGDRFQAAINDRSNKQRDAAELASLSPAKRRLAGLDEVSVAASSSFEILDSTLRDKISSMAGTEVRGNNVSSSDPKVTARLSAFAEKNPERLKQGMMEAKGKKPDFLDLDKDGDKNEPMKKAAADKKKTVKEEDGERKTTHGTERTKGNITTHTRNYEPDVEDDDDFNAEPRKAGRPKGKDKGPERVTGKAWKHKGSRVEESDDVCPHCGAKKVVDERSVSQAQAHMMAGAAHNPKFAKKVGVKSSVAKEFNKADTGKDIGKLPKKVKEADAAPAAKNKGDTGYNFGTSGIYDSLNRQVDNLITEGMSVTVNMTTDDTGQPHKDITVHADGDDAAKLAELLNLAGIHQSEQSCSSCGQSPCGCNDQMVDEEDQNITINAPSNSPDPVFATVNQVAGPNTGGGPNAPHVMINPADATFNPPGDMGQSTVNAGPGARRVPGTTNENKQADLGMSLYKELQQFKGK